MKRRSSPSSLEVLESRIAPATIKIGALPDGSPVDTAADTEYIENNPSPEFQTKFFTNTSTSGDLISAVVDSAATSNTFFLRLSAGDEVEAFTQGGSYLPFITVTKGQVIAFFVDYNNDNNYNPGELTGLALGKDVEITVSGAVSGDVVTNLDEHGNNNVDDDTLDMAGLVSPNQGISNLAVTGGSVFGKVLSGGSIQKLTIAGNVDAVLVGNAAHQAGFDFFPNKTFADSTIQLQPGGAGQVSFIATPGLKGASISNALIRSIGPHDVLGGGGVSDSFTGRLQAGSGGAGALGGNVTNIQITNDTDGFSLLAGFGGTADPGAGKPNGGQGGNISKVYISGIIDSTPNSADSIIIAAGDGGDGLSTAKGGKGGTASDIFVGFEINNGAVINSGDLLADSVLIKGGAGGDGKNGGVGGAANAIRVRVQTPDVNGDEIAVKGGRGGANLGPALGKAGAGGSVNDVDLRNEVLTFDADILVEGGDGGTTVGDSVGAKGGSVSNATLLSFDLQVIGGDGSDGKSGGRGADVSSILFIQDESILAQNVLINAGKGGNANGGNAGNGGDINNVRSLTSDIRKFIVNSGVQGSGGTSIGGKGGKGGSVVGLDLQDADTANAINGVFDIRGGRGGDGSKGGGNGGDLQRTTITALNANLFFTAGDGGNVSDNGKGGKGGTVSTTQFTGDGLVDNIPVSAQILSGRGGSGKGSHGAGGAGGNIQLVNMNVDGSGSVIAGVGGDGQLANGVFVGSAAGRGGSIITTGVFARDGSGVLKAGDAGVGGAKPADGGNITGNASSLAGAQLSGLRAATTLTIQAGNGSHGGAGGSVRGIAYGSTADSLTPTPSGNIVVAAGNGSADGKFAGRGGSISNVFGSVSSGDGTSTSLVGGFGGGSALKAAAGGSVSNVVLSLGGGPNVLLTIQAGDAGDTVSGARGASGGNVAVIGVSDIDPFTNFRSIAAGNGGDAAATGGRGGSITSVAVQDHDIGVRSGQSFGFTTMGGLFAGAGGKSTGGGRSGESGSVAAINANSIAAIVAGRTQFPEMATSVSRIFLNDDNILVSRNGAFAQNGPFTLTFGVDTTDLIPGNATRQQVEAKLNAIPSIINAGGVNVTNGPLVGNTPGYIVTWKVNGDRVPLTGEEQDSLDVTELAKGAFTTPTIVEAIPGQVTLNILESTSGQRDLNVIETVPGDRPFAAIEVSRGDILTGSFESERLDLFVLQPFPKGEFTLNFQGEVTANLPQNANAAGIDAALEALGTITATNLSGDARGAVVVAQTTPLNFTVTFTNPGFQDLIFGDFLLPESQRLNLGSLITFPTGQFTLDFNGDVTNPITIGNSTPAQTAMQIEAELNALTSIQLTATPPGGLGSVKVVAGAPGVFNITFDTTLPDTNPDGTANLNDRNNGDQPNIVGIGFLPETQQVQLGTLPADPDAIYALTFGADTTANLPVAQLSASQMQTALNLLPSVQATGPGNTGMVTVTDAGNNNFNVVFNSIGDKTGITGIGLEHEFQDLDLGTLFNVPSSDFLLTFNGETTAARVPGTASAQQIEDALNMLATIKATGPGNTGAVDVTTTATPGVFSIEFNTVGDQPPITSAGFVHEAQNIDIYAVGDFQIAFGMDTTSRFAPNTSAAQIDAALEALPSIQALQGPAGDKVEVVLNPPNSPNSSYNVIFHGDGDQLTFGGKQFEPITVTTKINGNPGIQEQQIVAYLVKGELDALTYSIANLVGAIADVNEIDANVFHFINNNGTPGFQVGDTPIDGLVMARFFDQLSVNFTPEAKLTASGFFDSDNVI